MGAIRTLAVAGACAMFLAPIARADEVSDLKAQMQIMRQQMEMMQKRLDTVSDRVDHAPLPAIAPAAGPVAQAPDGKHGFLERKPGDSITFYTPGGELTAYGNLDVSIDGTTKGFNGKSVSSDPAFANAGSPAIGRLGWQPALSTNSSYIGLRGFENLGSLPFNFVWQLETDISFTATSGTRETNSNQSNNVNGGLTTRNTYIGLANNDWGAIKVGKTTAPYNNSTAALNPFAGTLGDNSVVMGNSGGDNRVEFGTRLDHSIWYESPNLGGFTFNALYSPGQNRSTSSDIIANGESDCTGGNIPGSGGTFTGNPANFNCSDGSFSDAISASVAYKRGPFYITAAYERHFKVNRASDIPGIFADPTNPVSLGLQAQDIADEDAAKIGAQYILPTDTTISAIVEDMHRYVPSSLSFQNERQRWGTWLALSQKITDRDSVHLGWAHAFKTPGDPGQHNDQNVTPPGGTAGTDFTAGSNADNTANMYTLLLVHQFTKSLSIYFNYAATVNGPAAHYDLGAGGHGLKTDCHDSFGAQGGTLSTPHCWTGFTLQGASLGMDWKF